MTTSHTEIDLADLEHNLTNHPPTDARTPDLFEAVRHAAKELGETILACCPPSRERSLAVTNLEQTVMWAVASIARNESAALKHADEE